MIALVALASLLLLAGWLLLRPPTDASIEFFDAPLSAQAPVPPSDPGPSAVEAPVERAEPAVAAAPPEAPPPAPVPGETLADRLFREACLWIANGGEPIAKVRDSAWALDAKFDLDRVRHEGPMRLWGQLPDHYRQELTDELTPGHAKTTRVMNRGDLYVQRGSELFQHMNRSADGTDAIRQVQGDMERLADLTTFVTLAGLKGPGVVFEYLGEKSPNGNFARAGGGTWAKIVRKAAGRPNIYLWLAHTKDAQGDIHATYPGVVRVDGDPMANVPTEDFLLQDWRDPPAGAAHRYRSPNKILAFQIRPGQQPLNFLTAIVTDLKINTGIDPTRFDPR